MLNREIKRESGIYCIINSVTNRKYIGSTVDMYNRMCEHIGDLRNNKHCNKYLQRSWNKYGENNFQFIKIENCEKESLVNKETEAIFKFNTLTRSSGYNLIDPRSNSGCLTSKPLFIFDKGGKLISEFKSIREASRLMNLSKTSVSTAIDKGVLRKNYFISSSSKFIVPNIDTRSVNGNKGLLKPVYKLDSSNSILDRYNSVKEAASVNSLMESNISHVCLGRKKSHGGFKWKYVN